MVFPLFWRSFTCSSPQWHHSNNISHFTTVFHSLLHLSYMVYFCASVLCCLLALSANLVQSGIFLHFLKLCCLEASICYFCFVFFDMINQNWTSSFNTKELVRTVIQLSVKCNTIKKNIYLYLLKIYVENFVYRLK